MLDLAPLQREVSPAVPANGPGITEPVGERLLEVTKQDFDLQPGPAEHDRLHATTKEGLGNPLALQR
jgi:hypothetical protein